MHRILTMTDFAQWNVFFNPKLKDVDLGPYILNLIFSYVATCCGM